MGQNATILRFFRPIMSIFLDANALVRFTAAAADDERRRVRQDRTYLTIDACAVCDNDDARTQSELIVGKGQNAG